MVQSKYIGALLGTALVLNLSACNTRTIPLPKTQYDLSSGEDGQIEKSGVTYHYRFANYAAGAGMALVCTGDDTQSAELQDTDIEQGGITLLSLKGQDVPVTTCAEAAANLTTLFDVATQACTLIGRTMQPEEMLAPVFVTEDGYVHLPKVCA
ncbi:hypothetical protein [Aliiroseovarius sp. S253]|uniref:hypothetical protein n=1 Tax=Aliiroseovarius sp. S253 TaxID=3415133 RepID=UPI003C7A9478